MHFIPKDQYSFLNQQDAIYLEHIKYNELFEDLVLKEDIVKDQNNRFLIYKYYLPKSIYSMPLLTIVIDEEGTLISSFCEICGKNKHCPHRLKAFVQLKEKFDLEKEIPNWSNIRLEKIKQIEKNTEDEIKAAKREKLRKESLEKVEKLLFNLNKHDALVLTEHVALEPTLNLSYRSTILDIEAVSLNAGIDRMYRVGSINSFLERIKNAEEHSYGKNLSFFHRLDNFDKKSRKLIEILNDVNMRREGYRKTLYLSADEFETILLNYQGSSIGLRLPKEANPQNKEVNLKPIDVALVLDDNYQIKLKKPIEGFVFDGPNHSFCISDTSVDLLHFANNKIRPLYLFIKENPNFDFEPIKDVLIKEILSRHYEHIEINEQIKQEVGLKDFVISAYFDYDGDRINLITKYVLDEQEITEIELINNHINNLKIEKYKLQLQTLGIEDNKISDSGKIFQFLKSNLADLHDISTIYLSERLKQLQARKYRTLKVNLSYETGMMAIFFEDSEYSDEELAKIIKGLRKKTKYIKLKKDVILEIDEEEGERLLNTIDEFGLNINNLNKPQNIPLYQALKLADKDINIVDFNQDKQLEQLLYEIANYKKAPFPIPLDLNEVMRTYQKEAFLWMKTLVKHGFGGILADDMGLGKTLEMISVILSDETKAPSLIVCPKSLAYNWKKEFEMWAPDLHVVNIIGLSNIRKDIINNINNNERRIYISSYDSLRNDIEYYQNINFQYLVLDEAQFIKNAETMKAQSVKNVNSKNRFVLTGTPIENTVIDLWSIFDFLMPGYLQDLSKFRKKYEKAIVRTKDSNIISLLVQKISPFILRRIKQDVIKDLPEKVTLIQSATMTENQKKVYAAELKRTKDIIISSDNKIEILACITRLRQICVDPSLYIENYQGGSGKLELALEIIEENIASGHKIILFSQFVSVFPKLEAMLKQKKINYFVLTGKTNAKERIDLANEFNENEAIKVFLVSLKAGGTGLNLVGADMVLHLDPWWNVAVENQATDRTHRIGQKRLVHVIKLVCEESIEQKVLELQEKKKALVEMLVADDDTNIQKLSKDDLNYLLDYDE